MSKMMCIETNHDTEVGLNEIQVKSKKMVFVIFLTNICAQKYYMSYPKYSPVYAEQSRHLNCVT